MGGGWLSVDDCLSRLSALLLSSLVEAESSGASANFSRLRLTDDALLNDDNILVLMLEL